MKTRLIAAAVAILAAILVAVLFPETRPWRAKETPLPLFETAPPIHSQSSTRSVHKSSETIDTAAGPIEIQAVANQLRRWPTGSTLKVAFIGGSTAAHSRIANIAHEWTNAANIKFDFGFDPATNLYRQATATDTSSIRISFDFPRKPSIWARIGKDAITQSQPGEPTINLQGFSSSPPEPTRFRALVLHEFGHVLGLEHEHKNPNGDCDQEINWLWASRLLSAAPNFWSEETINDNLRKLPDSTAYEATDYDSLSVMNYALDPRIYHSGEQSVCYVPLRSNLSNLDRVGIEKAYPENAIAAFEEMQQQMEQILNSDALSENDEFELESLYRDFSDRYRALHKELQ